MKNHCQEIEPLLAAYALDALNLNDREHVERHISACRACQRVFSDFKQVADGMLTAIPPQQPPARLRARLLAATVPRSAKPGWSLRVSTSWSRFSKSMVILALVVLMVLNVNALRNMQTLFQANDTLLQQNRAYQTTISLLTYPETKVAVIENGPITGTIVYDPERNVAVLNMWGLAELPADQDYQVWLIQPDEQRLSGGVFNSQSNQDFVSHLIQSPLPLADFKGIGVTIEPVGGSPSPTGARVLGVDL